MRARPWLPKETTFIYFSASSEFAISSHHSHRPQSVHIAISPRQKLGLLWGEWTGLFTALLLWLFLPNNSVLVPAGFIGLIVAWLARGVRLGKLSRATPFDLPLVLFLLSALLAYTVSPAEGATVRLGLLLGAVTLYYTLVNSRTATLAIFVKAMVLLTAIGSLYLASQHDWTAATTDLALTQIIGRFLNIVTPNFNVNTSTWLVARNWIDSSLLVVLPLSVAWFLRTVRTETRETREWITAGGATVVLGIALLLTESWTAWLLLLSALLVAAFWQGLQQLWKRFGAEQPFLTLATIAFVGIGITLLLIILLPLMVLSLEQIVGTSSITRRLAIYEQSWYLAQATPLTGGGLAAFPMLYAIYIEVLPIRVFLAADTGNAAYLNILVEQGWLGLISFSALLGLGLGKSARRFDRAMANQNYWRLASIAGIWTICLASFIHATLVSTAVLPFLLIPFALLVRVGQGKSKRRKAWLDQQKKVALLASTGLVAAMMLFAGRHVLAVNSGAVQMARAELVDWPTLERPFYTQTLGNETIDASFRQAVSRKPRNVVANYRLGLRAWLREDYETAVQHLEVAHSQNPAHLGIRKTLGWSYVAAGNIDGATKVLAPIHDTTKDELMAYRGWWQRQGREQLVAHAGAVQERLETK